MTALVGVNVFIAGALAAALIGWLCRPRPQLHDPYFYPFGEVPATGLFPPRGLSHDDDGEINATLVAASEAQAKQ